MSNAIAAAATRRGTTRATRARGLSRVECTILALTAIALAAAAVSSTPRAATTEGVSTTTIRVRSGDSLWSIAAAHPVEGLDTARAAELIAEINDLEGAALTAGSAILVPGDVSAGNVAMR